MIAWEIARASAFVAFACYTLVVAWGIGLSGRIWKPPAAQRWDSTASCRRSAWSPSVHMCCR